MNREDDPDRQEGHARSTFEFNADGTEVWVSNWNLKDSKQPNGEIVIFDAETLEEKNPHQGALCSDRQVQRPQPFEPCHLM